MARWTTTDRFEIDGYGDESAELVVQEKTGHKRRLIFDGPIGLETTTTFTHVEIDRNTAEFYRDPRGRKNRRTYTGSMELYSDDMREFLQQYKRD